MPISSDLLDILACPSIDHAPLELAGAELVCTSCASRFPIRDGIPVLLADEAVPGPNGLGVPAESGTAAGGTGGDGDAGDDPRADGDAGDGPRSVGAAAAGSSDAADGLHADAADPERPAE
jgi:uncharacterized protein